MFDKLSDAEIEQLFQRITFPKYRCRKKVRAAKIVNIFNMVSGDIAVTPNVKGRRNITVPARFAQNNENGLPGLGWYLLVQPNGAMSFLPPDEFKEQYVRV